MRHTERCDRKRRAVNCTTENVRYDMTRYTNDTPMTRHPHNRGGPAAAAANRVASSELGGTPAPVSATPPTGPVLPLATTAGLVGTTENSGDDAGAANPTGIGDDTLWSTLAAADVTATPAETGVAAEVVSGNQLAGMTLYCWMANVCMVKMSVGSHASAGGGTRKGNGPRCHTHARVHLRCKAVTGDT